MCISYKIIPLKKPAKRKTYVNNRLTSQLWRASNAQVEQLRHQRDADFKRSEPDYDEELKIEGRDGPMAILSMRDKLRSIPLHLHLKISSSSKVLVEDLAAAARMLGHNTTIRHFRRQHFVYVSSL